MSHLLWKSYWQNDVDRFRRLLASGGYSTATASARTASNIGGGPTTAGTGGSASPGAFGTSPRFPNTGKSRRSFAFGGAVGGGGGGGGSGPGGSAAGLAKADVNSRDHAGLTLLLRAASSTSEHAIAFARALLDHPAVDIYVQDPESGWNALHRALYAGNISIARLLLAKERGDLADGAAFVGTSSISRIGLLIKTKDHEGNSPFDLFAATIGERSLKEADTLDLLSSMSDDSDQDEPVAAQTNSSDDGLQSLVDGDELFVFGSNKNMSLGVGDESDRQYPERVNLRRPDHLFHRFYDEYLERTGQEPPAAGSIKLEELPAMILTRPLEIHDVILSKLHSAVLTTDPVSNLYISGVGRGGRLGLNDDQRVRFTFVPVQGGLANRKVVKVALGLDHSMAVTDTGELWTWGSNAHGQLGYTLPPPAKTDEDPMSATPRQVFGPLRRETVEGVAASAIHSVAWTGNSLYCWGKNIGQLGITDADARSLDVQPVPRKVAASLLIPIVMVSAIDKATSVLLANHTVCVFTSYGYNMVKFPTVDPFANYRMRSFTPQGIAGGIGGHRICHIASGGDTIAAVTRRGDLFVMGLNNNNVDATSSVSTTNPSKVKEAVGQLRSLWSARKDASTTNPSKIKEAVGQPKCIWSARKDGVRSVGVGEHGSVIISTESGAVWRRIKRATAKDAYAGGAGSAADLKSKKDFKFQRVPLITKVVTVRSSAFGAFAAVRRDSAVMKEQLAVSKMTIWDDLAPLLCFEGFVPSTTRTVGNTSAESGEEPSRLPQPLEDEYDPQAIPRALLWSADLEQELARHLQSHALRSDGYDAIICSSSHPNVKIPIHSWILSARSPVFRTAFAEYRPDAPYTLPDLLTIEEADGTTLVTIAALDLITVLNIVVFLYLDQVVPFWALPRLTPPLTQKYRQIRVDVQKTAGKLGLYVLEAAARMQKKPAKALPMDLASALQDPVFSESGDVNIELSDGQVTVHTALLCRRCPFFEGFFHGRSEGMWLAERRDAAGPDGRVSVDLTHFELEPFTYVLRHIYGDAGEEMFDSTVSATFDDFMDLVMDVLAIANELMIDRLSEICQKVMGRFATTRSIARLLNDISPCSVAEFKDAGLEYLCMQIETMLENHLIDDLDEDLLLELDGVVRDNQRAHCPAASGTWTEDSLHERHPNLALDIQEERHIRLKEMAFKANLVNQRDDDRKLSSSFKGRAGSLDDGGGLTPSLATPDRSKRRSSRNEPFSPGLRPKASAADLMFDMDDEEYIVISPFTTKTRQETTQAGTPTTMEEPKSGPARDHEGGLLSSPTDSRAGGRKLSVPPASTSPATTPRSAGGPWLPSALPTSKLDLRQIMSEASNTTQSALTAGLAAAAGAPKPALPQQQPGKLSQKERKKRELAAARQKAAAALQTKQAASTAAAWEKPLSAGATSPASSPWKPTPTTPKTSLKETFAAAAPVTVPMVAKKPLVAAESSPKSVYRRTASPDTRFPGQSRTPTMTTPSTPKTAIPSTHTTKQPPPPPLVPHSKSYIPPAPKSEPAPGLLSMADIIGQQRREQEAIQSAMAKRSLQEIQQEQEFQEWWDQESRRAQEEEARRIAREKRDSAAAETSSSGGGGGGAGRGGRGRRSRASGKAAPRGGGGATRGGGGTGAAPTAASDKTSLATAGGSTEGSAAGGPGSASRGRGRSRGGAKGVSGR